MTALPQFLRFCIIGAAGFLADSGVLYLLNRGAGLDLYGARLISFLAAATLTWIGNRSFTFKIDRPPSRREWGEYLVVNAVGAAVNYGTYAACIALFTVARDQPILAIAAGSALALIVNFLANKRVVFRS